nr:hypothetical protein [Tanacetum cinerariifolium]
MRELRRYLVHRKEYRHERVLMKKCRLEGFRGPPRCAFKVDIQKPYDTVERRFLGNILTCFGFHPTMIKLLMACVTLAYVFLNVNGEIHGYFQGRRGLEQSDALST